MKILLYSISNLKIYNKILKTVVNNLEYIILFNKCNYLIYKDNEQILKLIFLIIEELNIKNKIYERIKKKKK